ncbi:MAG: hypothetical protein EBU52_14495 [Cytophagia bacterium]|nr:hypothetical protein [Cytophagia bacterium]
MLNIKKLGVSITLLLLTTNLSAQSSATLQWIVGTWKINTGQGYVVEQWKQLPTHDFPQRIAYRRVKNQLYASIEGLKKGKYQKQNFDFILE